MLYLNSGIHLHEKVLITIDNTLKGRHRVQPTASPKRAASASIASSVLTS